MKKTFFLLITLLSALMAEAQMVIESNGKVVVGPDTRPGDDISQILSMTIQGKYGEYNAGSKLAFGDFGRYDLGGWNAFVGEFGSTDSDILWLHGKNGVRMTSLKGNYLVSEWIYPDGGLPRYTFYNGVRADRLAISSDDHHKSSIIEIPMALPRLLQLTGIMYKYASIDNTVDVGDVGQNSPQERVSEKEANDTARIASLLNTRDQDERRYGLKASEVLVLFPELVEYDAQDNEYINYIELIPVIISAIKELHHAIVYSGVVLNVMDGYNTTQSDSSSDNSKNRPSGHGTNTPDTHGAMLYQNTPNPFSSTTEIGYYIPNDATSADIYIFNLTGELLQTYPINAFGDGSVQISGSTFTAGMYIYSLVVDGNIVDNKRMILTK